MKKSLLIIPGLLVLIGGFSLAYSLMDASPILLPGDETAYRDDGSDDRSGVRERRSTRVATSDEERAKVESAQATERVTVKLMGRVVDRASKPVANAEVALFSRNETIGWTGRFGRGERGAGERGRGEQGGRNRGRGGPTGRESGRGEQSGRDRGGRGRRGRTSTASAKGDKGAKGETSESPEERMRSRMAQFQLKKQPGAVRTDEDGRFELQGYFRARSSFEIRVDHEVYVPKTVRRRAEKEDKDTEEVRDIVLDRGAVIAGVVVDEFDRPVANAKVGLRSTGRSRGRGRENEATPGGSTDPRQRGQRGQRGQRNQSGQGSERGGEGGRRGRERGGFDFASLMSGRTRTESVTSDEKGRFTFQRVAAGKFVANAEADKHLPGKSPEFELQEGQNFGDARVQLGIGARVTGTVLDEAGSPIANAEVVASWDKAVSQAEAAAAKADPQKAAEAAKKVEEAERGNRGRGGRGGRGGFGSFGGFGDLGQGGDFASRIAEMMASRGRGGRGGRTGRGGSEKTKTDANGAFVLDSLPHAGFRLKVEHDEYIEQVREDVQAADEPQLELRMVKNLVLTGTVVDAISGEPVVVYGIRARQVRDPNRNRSEDRGRERREDRGERRGRRSSENDAEAQARAQARATEAIARRAEQAALKARVDGYLKQRLGPTGDVSRRTPEPSDHVEGKFILDQLEPGFYAIDVDGPGFVKTAAAIVHMEIAAEQAPLMVQLMPGSKVMGQVVDLKTGKPMKRVRVELILPPLVQPKPKDPSKTGSSSRADRDRSNRFAEMFSRMGRTRGGRTEGSSRGERRLDDTRTDDEGRFEFDPQLPGEYLIRARFDGYPDQPKNSFIVQAGKDSELRVDLLAGAQVFGQVLNVEEGERVSVVFTHKNGTKKTARVDRREQTYEIKGLEIGEYFVSVESSSGRDRGGRGGFGRGGFGSRDSSSDIAKLRERPDLILKEGDEIRYNAGLEGQHLGSVKGSITLNMKPARGLEVSIALKVATPDPTSTDSSQRRRSFRRGGSSTSSLKATVDREGNFEIKNVPPGDYALSVSRSSRGGRGGRGGSRGGSSSSSLHKEMVLIVSGRAVERQIALQTGRLQLTIQAAETGEPVSRASVALVLAGDAAGKKTSEWSKLPSYTKLQTRGGKIDSADVKPGTYAYAISGRGLAETLGQVTVMQGDNPVPTIVSVKKGDGKDSNSRTSQWLERLDKDGDGSYSKEELGRLADRMMEADTNGDGKISKEEMAAWNKLRQEKRDAERAAQRAKSGEAGSGSTRRGGGTQRGGSTRGGGGGQRGGNTQRGGGRGRGR